MTITNPGRDFEKLIAASAKAFEPDLRLRKNDPRFVGAHGARGQAVGHITGAGGLDFEGRWQHLWVGIEAKTTATTTSFALSLLRDHQVTRIRRAHDEGAIAFALVEVRFPDAPRYFMLDWPTLEPWWKGEHGRQSIPIGALSLNEVKRAGRVVDLLAPIRTLAGEQRARRLETTP